MQTLNISSCAGAERFRQLQSHLRDRWWEIELFELSDNDMLVVPSLSLEQRELEQIQGCYHYEERLLFSLMCLRNPQARLIYVTSEPVHPKVIDYYLQLLHGISVADIGNRLLLLSTYDASSKPLTQKILQRPRLLERIRQGLRPEKSYIVCYRSTPLERDLSVQLGIPLHALDPDLLYWGTKTGGRQIFAECEVPHPNGSHTVWNAKELAGAAADLWERQPTLQRMVVKLNEGSAGEGNALLDLRPIQHLVTASRTERTIALGNRFTSLSFQTPSENWGNFCSRLPELGAIVEAWIEGEEKRSPSLQGRITLNGNVEILSTHDQILDRSDRVYLGCCFPARAAYRLRLQELGLQIGRCLAQKGVLERFSVDFIAVRQPKEAEAMPWDLQAIEINLRKGGTTHPFMLLKSLTGGYYDLSDGLFYSQQGNPKYYIATDSLQKARYRGLLPNDLLDIMTSHKLHFDSSTETGTVFHLMGCLSEFGKLGLTSIGNSPQQAREIYNKVVKVLDEATQTTNQSSWSSPFKLPMTNLQ